MAESPAHQIGEYIGSIFETMIVAYLSKFIDKNQFYIDYYHPRKARNYLKDVIRYDIEGNKHKLDIVIEKNGTDSVYGQHRAFIEMAWRRYTKHSKNKVQEISGAILPIAKKYAADMPFCGAVLSGNFSDTSIKQLRSEGFYVLFFPYNDICSLFKNIGISIETEEDTDIHLLNKIAESLRQISLDNKKKLQALFESSFHEKLEKYKNKLMEHLNRRVVEVIVTPLHGCVTSLHDIEQAIDFIVSYNERQSNIQILRYEVTIRYDLAKGVEYTKKCRDKEEAIQFLNLYK
jgi:hypothetical protein